VNWEARLALLCQRLQAIQDDQPPEADPGVERLVKTFYKLVDVFEFAEVPETRGLLVELNYLTLALIDLLEGRKVPWLAPRYRPKGARLGMVTVNLRARYAAVMAYLMASAGHTKEQAAKFVAMHGAIGRLLEKGRQPHHRAADWQIVMDWYEKYGKTPALARQCREMAMIDGVDAEEVARMTLQTLDQILP
jgi:hypothetical protein